MRKTTTVAALAALIGASTLGGMALAHGRSGDGPAAMLTQMDANGDGAITMEEISLFHANQFEAADTDGNGALSKEELLAARDKARSDRAAAGMDRMISRLDENGDGEIGIDEQKAGDRMTRMFERLDADKDGTISAEELKEAKAKRGGRGGKRHGKGHGHGKPGRG